MKIKREENSFIQIHLFLLLVTYEYTFIYRIDKHRRNKVTGKNLPSHPSYGHICKRVNKLNDGTASIAVNTI